MVDPEYILRTPVALTPATPNVMPPVPVFRVEFKVSTTPLIDASLRLPDVDVIPLFPVPNSILPVVEMIPDPVLKDELFVMIPPVDPMVISDAEVIPPVEMTSDPVVILADPMLRGDTVVMPPTDPNRSTVVEVIPKVVPNVNVPPVVILPFPKLREEPLVVMPLGADKLRTPLEVMPKVVPTEMVPVVVIFPAPKLIEDPFVEIPLTDPN